MFTLFLNPRLLSRMNVQPEEVARLYALHDERKALFDSINVAIKSGALINWPMNVAHLEDIEYKMQHAWGFDTVSSKHTWWHRIPGCNCDGEVNAALFGEDSRKINPACKAHQHLYNKPTSP